MNTSVSRYQQEAPRSSSGPSFWSVAGLALLALGICGAVYFSRDLARYIRISKM